DGYARNYLLPRNLAMLASAANVRQLDHEKQVIELRQQKLKGTAEEQAKKIGAVEVKITRKVGDQNKLFGSVTALDIAEGLAKSGRPSPRSTSSSGRSTTSPGAKSSRCAASSRRWAGRRT